MEKKILVINAGSSSIKYKVFNYSNDEVVASGQCEKIGNDLGLFSIEYNNGLEHKEELPLPNHDIGTRKILKELLDKKIINSINDICGIGHRVVMGGTEYSDSIVINEVVLQKLIDYIELAPLHNAPEVETIKVFQGLLPNVKNVAVFDTSFHTTLDPVNDYALNLEVKTKYNIKKYGMHGTSYRYITEKMKSILNKDSLNLVVCHLGNGASICAIKNNKSINTSMGLTPLEGLMMGTRCGDIDPAIALYLINKGLTSKEVDDIFNKKSGLKGISGVNDFRDIENLIKQGDKNAGLARKMFINRVVKYIVSYANELENKVDAIVMTAGVGENARHVLELIFEHIYVLGLDIDHDKINQKYADSNLISTNKSKTPVYLVRTNEELMIEQDVKKLI